MHIGGEVVGRTGELTNHAGNVDAVVGTQRDGAARSGVDGAAGDAIAGIGIQDDARDEETNLIAVAAADDGDARVRLDHAIDEDLGGARDADGGTGIRRFDRAEDLNVALGRECHRGGCNGGECALPCRVGDDRTERGKRNAEGSEVAPRGDGDTTGGAESAAEVLQLTRVGVETLAAHNERTVGVDEQERVGTCPRATVGLMIRCTSEHAADDRDLARVELDAAVVLRREENAIVAHRNAAAGVDDEASVGLQDRAGRSGAAGDRRDTADDDVAIGFDEEVLAVADEQLDVLECDVLAADELDRAGDGEAAADAQALGGGDGDFAVRRRRRGTRADDDAGEIDDAAGNVELSAGLQLAGIAVERELAVG